MASDASIARAKGWMVGTRLIGDEGHGPSTIEITAIGRHHVLAIWNGGLEMMTCLDAREWTAVSETDDGVHAIPDDCRAGCAHEQLADRATRRSALNPIAVGQRVTLKADSPHGGLPPSVGIIRGVTPGRRVLVGWGMEDGEYDEQDLQVLHGPDGSDRR